MSKYDIYEHEGATFRKPADRKQPYVDDVLHGDKWVPYKGDRQAPCMFGDLVRTEGGEIAAAEKLAMRA